MVESNCVTTRGTGSWLLAFSGNGLWRVPLAISDQGPVQALPISNVQSFTALGILTTLIHMLKYVVL